RCGPTTSSESRRRTCPKRPRPGSGPGHVREQAQRRSAPRSSDGPRTCPFPDRSTCPLGPCPGPGPGRVRSRQCARLASRRRSGHNRRPMTEHERMTWAQLGEGAREIAQAVVDDGWTPDIVLAIARGGLLVAGALGYALDVKNTFTMNVEFYTGVDERLE